MRRPCSESIAKVFGLLLSSAGCRQANTVDISVSSSCRKVGGNKQGIALKTPDLSNRVGVFGVFLGPLQSRGNYYHQFSVLFCQPCLSLKRPRTPPQVCVTSCRPSPKCNMQSQNWDAGLCLQLDSKKLLAASSHTTS